jgi:hypothetical protein
MMLNDLGKDHIYRSNCIGMDSGALETWAGPLTSGLDDLNPAFDDFRPTIWNQQTNTLTMSKSTR